MAQVKGVTLTIGDRRFTQESPTFEQDMFIMEQAVAAGLDEAVIELNPDSNDLETGIKRLLIQAYQRGALFLLIAAMVTEEGTDWSVEQARRNAEFFRTIRDPKDKDQLHPALVGALLAFFENGVSLRRISSTSSDPETANGATPVLTPKLAPKPSMNPEAAAALFNSGRMAPSSEKSPSTKGKSRKTSSP